MSIESIPVRFRISPAHYDRLKETGRAHNRSIANLVQMVVQDALIPTATGDEPLPRDLAAEAERRAKLKQQSVHQVIVEALREAWSPLG